MGDNDLTSVYANIANDFAALGIANSNLSSLTTVSAPTVKVPTVDFFLAKYELNRIAIDHKVTQAEILKLKEVAPDYVNEIKEKIAREVSRDIIKKTTFTKKKDEDTDVNHFIGRVWVFTEAELKDMIKEITNV